MRRINCFAYITVTPVLLTGVLLAGARMVRGNATDTNEGGKQ